MVNGCNFSTMGSRSSGQDPEQDIVNRVLDKMTAFQVKCFGLSTKELSTELDKLSKELQRASVEIEIRKEET